MHIEPGVVSASKMILSYFTALGATGLVLKYTRETLKHSNIIPFALSATLATFLTFIFFEVLPKFPVGVSEVHFIFGSTLFLLLGLAPAAIGLCIGLALQGVLLAPADIPQYFINITTLLIPLFGISWVAKSVISSDTAYVDLTYSQVLKLSITYQTGIITWVAFWAFYGQGFGSENVSSVLSFGSAYLLVILIEPIVDLGVLALAKSRQDLARNSIFTSRLSNPG